MIIPTKIVLCLTLPLVNYPVENIKQSRINIPYIVQDESWIDSVNSSRTDKIITNKDAQFKIKIRP